MNWYSARMASGWRGWRRFGGMGRGDSGLIARFESIGAIDTLAFSGWRSAGYRCG